jgi:hypothetical protein
MSPISGYLTPEARASRRPISTPTRKSAPGIPRIRGHRWS